MPKPTITILVPLYNEGRNIPKLASELHAVTAGIDRYDFSLLFVDDGSSDDSVAQIEAMAAKDSRIRLLELSRNFGKEIALTAGIDALDCDAVIIMDADLQHPPSYIPQLIDRWEHGSEVVVARRTRIDKQPLARRLGSYAFYKLLNAISDFPMEPGTTDFRLLDREVIDALKGFREKNRMVRGLVDWMGFRRSSIDFEAPERTAGVAGYSYAKLAQLALNSFMSFSLLPLRLAGYLGLFSTMVFGGLLLVMGIDKMTADVFRFSSISFVIVVNALLNGVVLLSIGLVALYIGHIHTEAVDRPLYLLRRKKGPRIHA
jgi:glycosyltransferase involved in cell wall biosynthesis